MGQSVSSWDSASFEIWWK